MSDIQRLGYLVAVGALSGAKSETRGKEVHASAEAAAVEVSLTACALAECCAGVAYVGRLAGLPLAFVVGSCGTVWAVSLKSVYEVGLGPEV